MTVTRHTIEALLDKAKLEMSPEQKRIFVEHFTPFAEEAMDVYNIVPFTLTEAWLKGFIAAWHTKSEEALEYTLALINRDLREKNAELVAINEALEHQLGVPE